MKKNIYQPIILFLLMLFTIISVIQVSYGFFDIFVVSKSSTINIGNWLNWQPEPEDVKEYVENIKYPEDEDMAEYVLEIIGEYVDDEYVIDEIFSDYTMPEIIEIIDLINEFTDSFLENEDGELVFSDVVVEPIDINNINSFAPGDVQYIKKIVQTAEFAANPWWTPVSIQILLSAPDGVDLSDFSIEVLIDLSPFTVQTPFSYGYRVKDSYKPYYTTVLQEEVGLNSTLNLPDIDSIDYINSIFDIDQNKFLRFKHIYQAPSFTGEWKRFPEGPNLYLSPPATLDRQILTVDDEPNNDIGMTLLGRNDGRSVDMIFSFNERKARYPGDLAIIPITIVISRGQEIDDNDDILANQRTDFILPVVKMRVVKGNIYNNEL